MARCSPFPSLAVVHVFHEGPGRSCGTTHPQPQTGQLSQDTAWHWPWLELRSQEGRGQTLPCFISLAVCLQHFCCCMHHPGQPCLFARPVPLPFSLVSAVSPLSASFPSIVRTSCWELPQVTARSLKESALSALLLHLISSPPTVAWHPLQCSEATPTVHLLSDNPSHLRGSSVELQSWGRMGCLVNRNAFSRELREWGEWIGWG